MGYSNPMCNCSNLLVQMRSGSRDVVLPHCYNYINCKITTKQSEFVLCISKWMNNITVVNLYVYQCRFASFQNKCAGTRGILISTNND
jgi:ssDNA-binding Zn-finger/Zn-ribbon topoisomerase 1